MKTFHKILCCAAAFLSLPLAGASGQEVVAVPAEALGAAGIVSITATDGIQSINPSLMAEAKGLNATVSYTLPYHLTELQQVMGKVVYATKLVNITARVVRSGSDDSHYTQIGGGLSRKFHNWGIGMEYHAITHSLPYNGKYTSSFSRVGIHVEPTENWTLSVAVHNVERSKIEYEQSSFEIEPMAVAGVRWQGSDMFVFMGEVQKQWDYDAVAKIAAGIKPVQGLVATVGFSSLGTSLSCGVGYTTGKIGIHAGISHHDRLGVSSAASLSIRNIWGE